MRVMTILGTRPEIIRLSRVIPALDAAFAHTLVHTGQNHAAGLSGAQFAALGVRAPDVWLGAAGASGAETIARVIAGADAALAAHRPDAVLILGDTDSALAAIAARRRGVPVFHMEAGNRAFDPRVPEEVNRRIVDHIAAVNLPYTRLARENLLREGLAPDAIIVTGSPLHEVIDWYRPQIEASSAVAGLGLAPGGYFAASAHRAENVDAPERLRALIDVLMAVAARAPVVLSVHPRTAARLEALGGVWPAGVRALEPMAWPDWMALCVGARAVLSDSGTLTEEAALMAWPAVALRDAHERPEGDECGVTILAGLRVERVLVALDLLAARTGPPPCPEDYRARDVSRKIVEIIAGRVDWAQRRAGRGIEP